MKQTFTEAMREDVKGHTCIIWCLLEKNAMKKIKSKSLPLVLPVGTTHKVPVTVQEDVEDTKI